MSTEGGGGESLESEVGGFLKSFGMRGGPVYDELTFVSLSCPRKTLGPKDSLTNEEHT